MKVVDERQNGPGRTQMLSPKAKPEPFTVSVKLALPAGTVAGEMLVSVRNGGIVKVTGDEAAPPGFAAVMFTGPGTRARLEGTVINSPGVYGPRLVPFHEIVTPGSKPEPFTPYRSSLSNRPVSR